MRQFDLIVIGSGPAGQRGAIQAAKLGKRVALIERYPQVGGVSVHFGTIPSKTLREAVLYLTGWNQRGLYGRGYRLKQDLTMDDLMQRMRVTLEHETETIQHQLRRNQVTIIHGAASFVDPYTVRVEHSSGEAEDIGARRMLIAAGSRPVRPENIPFDDETIVDSDGILRVKRIPRSMIVIGAGVIGVEYASIFSAMDVKVTIVDGRNDMLPFLDHEVTAELTHAMRDNGITLRLGEQVAGVERDNEGQITTHLKSGKRLRAELVMVAAGRMGSTWGLALENAGVQADDRRRIAVNEHFQTNVSHIYAAGDVIGFPSLSSTSFEQGRIAACHAFGQNSCRAAAHFPLGIYAVPEASTIGATEQELTKKDIPYEIGVARLRETARGQIMGLNAGVLKLIFGLEDRRLLGVHIIGEGATELIHIGQAVLVHGGGLDYFLENAFNFPTLAEAYKTAALDAMNRFGR